VGGFCNLSHLKLVIDTDFSNALGDVVLHVLARPDARPKMIKRLAQQHEILALRDKKGAEAKAKRLGATKTAEHKQMDVPLIGNNGDPDARPKTIKRLARNEISRLRCPQSASASGLRRLPITSCLWKFSTLSTKCT
jgi:hypothetical protein